MQMEDRIDRRLSEHDRHLLMLDEKVDFFVRTSLPPKEGILFQGQIFDVHVIISKLVESANTRIVLIDNYVDATVLTQLNKKIGSQSHHLHAGNQAYPPSGSTAT